MENGGGLGRRLPAACSEMVATAWNKGEGTAIPYGKLAALSDFLERYQWH